MHMGMHGSTLRTKHAMAWSWLPRGRECALTWGPHLGGDGGGLVSFMPRGSQGLAFGASPPPGAADEEAPNPGCPGATGDGGAGGLAAALAAGVVMMGEVPLAPPAALAAAVGIETPRGSHEVAPALGPEPAGRAPTPLGTVPPAMPPLLDAAAAAASEVGLGPKMGLRACGGAAAGAGGGEEAAPSPAPSGEPIDVAGVVGVLAAGGLYPK